VEAGRLIAGRDGLRRLLLWVPRRPGSEAFARAVGLRYDSSLWQLRLEPSTPTVPPGFPDDVVVRPLQPGADEPAFADLVNIVFLDHPSPLHVEEDYLRVVHARPDFDPSTILLVSPASDPDALVGFCRIGTYHDDDGRLVGEVKLVGVRREARGRGLGRELVRWGIEAVRRRGAGQVYLSAEGENTGALALYEAIGFRPQLEWPHWVAPVRDAV
jgi:mycothiol synthase